LPRADERSLMKDGVAWSAREDTAMAVGQGRGPVAMWKTTSFPLSEARHCFFNRVWQGRAKAEKEKLLFIQTVKAGTLSEPLRLEP